MSHPSGLLLQLIQIMFVDVTVNWIEQCCGSTILFLQAAVFSNDYLSNIRKLCSALIFGFVNHSLCYKLCCMSFLFVRYHSLIHCISQRNATYHWKFQILGGYNAALQITLKCTESVNLHWSLHCSWISRLYYIVIIVRSRPNISEYVAFISFTPFWNF